MQHASSDGKTSNHIYRSQVHSKAIYACERARCAFQETPVLSPHEFATLMLIKDAKYQSDFDQADLIALADRDLITIGLPNAARIAPCVTDRGHALLARLGAAQP
jgi:hypothetical protein